MQVFLCLFLVVCSAFASSKQKIFQVEEIAKDLGIVWGMVFINKEELLFTEREGRIKILHIPSGKVSRVSGVPAVYAKGQGGLLDIALHPWFSKNRTIYFSYAKAKGSKQTTAVAKAILKGRNMVQKKDIFIAQPFLSASRHFGSRLVFAPRSSSLKPKGRKPTERVSHCLIDCPSILSSKRAALGNSPSSRVHKKLKNSNKISLYVTVGDRTKRHYAQKLNNHLGKILRITDEGQAPKDNPFVLVKGALPEIWSYGHRNPQGLFIHPETGQLWGQEHGPRGGDEINLIKKGKNYGWPVITYGREYWGPAIGEGFKKQGMEQPVKYYTPSIAPSGLLIYSGKKFKQWKHDFFSGALVLRHLNRLKISPSSRPIAGREERLLLDLNYRVRHVIEGPKGFIYVAVDRGKILKLTPHKVRPQKATLKK